MPIAPHIRRQLAENAGATTTTERSSRASSSTAVETDISSVKHAKFPKNQVPAGIASEMASKTIVETKRSDAQDLNKKVMACAPPLIRCDECDTMKHKSRFAGEDIQAILSTSDRADPLSRIINGSIISCIACKSQKQERDARTHSATPPKSLEAPAKKQEDVGDTGTVCTSNANAAAVDTDEDGFVLVELDELERDKVEYDLCD